MTRVKFVPMWLLGLWVVLSGFSFIGSDAPQAPAAVVERFHAALTANLNGGKSATFTERRNRLDPVVRETFDLPTMARLCTGAAVWGHLSDDDKKRITDAFADWTIATYAAQLKDGVGDAFATKGVTEVKKGDVTVDTRFLPKGDTPITFTYRVHQVGDEWRIVDIYVEGVGQMALHRSEFTAAIAAGGIENLLKHMRDLTARAEKEGA